MLPSIVHLVDDASPGGVTRMLDHIVKSPECRLVGVHRIVTIKRGNLFPPMLKADLLVSHLSVCWANLPLMTALRAAHARTPLVHFEHSYSERFHALNVESPERFAALMRTAYSLFDRVVAVSAPQAAWLTRRRFVEPENLTVINPCVDLAAFQRVPERPIGSTLKLGAIGRFDRQKGFDIVIDALRLTHDAGLELHLYGDGPERDTLVRRAGDDRRIVFHGFTDDVAGAMAECDAIVMPSRWEPFGLVALEAFAAGRPLLCSAADALAGHAGAGAVVVGDNTHFGWADMFDRSADIDLAAGVAIARRRAFAIEGRFATNWRTLVDDCLGGATEVRRVA